MTERGRGRVERDNTHLRVGPSSLAWEDDTLVVRIDEISAPWPRRVRGTVRLRPQIWPGRAFALDPGGRHTWQPIAPCARIEVDMQAPALRWSGHAYLDANHGSEPLAQAFHGWDWSRASRAGQATVLYDVRGHAGPRCLALQFDAAGGVQPFEPPAARPLPRSAWGLARTTRADPGRPAAFVRELESGPFYSRALLGATLRGEPMLGVHETLSLARFSAPWVRMLLPFRMPRRRR
jgi:carotenoid 1,2-hydratase